MIRFIATADPTPSSNGEIVSRMARDAALLQDRWELVGSIDYIGFGVRGDILTISILVPNSKGLRFTIPLCPRKIATCRNQFRSLPPCSPSS